MVTEVKALAMRKAQLDEALDALTKMHGAQSETVALIQTRLDTIQAEMTGSGGSEAPRADAPISLLGGPKVKDAAVLYVLVGGVLLFAFSGISTMFLVLMAVRLGSLPPL